MCLNIGPGGGTASGRVRAKSSGTDGNPEMYGYVAEDLLERERIRSSAFRVSGFGVDDHSIMPDQTYSARNREKSSIKADAAYAMSNIIYHTRSASHLNVPRDLADWLWAYLSRCSAIIARAFGRENPSRVTLGILEKPPSA